MGAVATRIQLVCSGKRSACEEFSTRGRTPARPCGVSQARSPRPDEPVNGISNGYKIVADFVMRGLIPTLLTTNFDTCLPDALRERQPHVRHIHEVNRGPGDYDQFNVYSKCQIIWLHNRAEQYSDKNSAGEVGALDRSLISLILPMINASPIIVIGYRGSEPSIMEGLFGQNKEGRLDFPNGVYWCSRHGDSLHPNVEAFSRRLGSNFRLLNAESLGTIIEESRLHA
jgi:hypothetical protein